MTSAIESDTKKKFGEPGNAVLRSSTPDGRVLTICANCNKAIIGLLVKSSGDRAGADLTASDSDMIWFHQNTNMINCYPFGESAVGK